MATFSVRGTKSLNSKCRGMAFLVFYRCILKGTAPALSIRILGAAGTHEQRQSLPQSLTQLLVSWDLCKDGGGSNPSSSILKTYKMKSSLGPSENGLFMQETAGASGLLLQGRAFPAALLGQDFGCSYCGRSWHLLCLLRGACPGGKELQMPLHPSTNWKIWNKRERVVSP